MEMESEFVAQLMALTHDEQRLAKLAAEVAPLLAEFTKPIDVTNEVKQRAHRARTAENFCETWGVTKAWIGDLIDRYEELGHEARSALMQMAAKAVKDVPEPCISSDTAAQKSA